MRLRPFSHLGWCALQRLGAQCLPFVTTEEQARASASKPARTRRDIERVEHLPDGKVRIHWKTLHGEGNRVLPGKRAAETVTSRARKVVSRLHSTRLGLPDVVFDEMGDVDAESLREALGLPALATKQCACGKTVDLKDWVEPHGCCDACYWETAL
jgi:hypothetical protein